MSLNHPKFWRVTFGFWFLPPVGSPGSHLGLMNPYAVRCLLSFLPIPIGSGWWSWVYIARYSSYLMHFGALWRFDFGVRSFPEFSYFFFITSTNKTMQFNSGNPWFFYWLRHGLPWRNCSVFCFHPELKSCPAQLRPCNRPWKCCLKDDIFW